MFKQTDDSGGQTDADKIRLLVEQRLNTQAQGYQIGGGVGGNEMYPLSNVALRMNHGGLTSLHPMGNSAKTMAAQGRNGDNTLLHVNTKELAGLESLLGKKLTVNPKTGMYEASGWSDLLPVIAGIGANMMFPGGGALLAGAVAGGTKMLQGGSLQQGLMAGLMAGGTAGIMGSLADAGTAATTQAATDLANTGAQQAGTSAFNDTLAKETTRQAGETAAAAANSRIPTVLSENPVIPTFNASTPLSTNTPSNLNFGETAQAVYPATTPINTAPSFLQSPEQIAQEAKMRAIGDYGGEYGGLGKAAPVVPNPTVLGSQRLGDISAGASNPDALKSAVLSKNGLMAASGLAGMMMEPKAFKPPVPMGSNYQPMTPYDRNVQFPEFQTGYGPSQPEYNYFPGNRFARPAAAGGSTEDISARDGIASFDKGTDMSKVRTLRRTYANREDAEQAATQKGSVAQKLGITSPEDPSLTYAFGPKQALSGDGDGMSDEIDASIGDKTPARLSDGEFVVPADVVSGLGNGSTKAGSKVLYAMLDRVRHARTGTKKQGNEIDAGKMMPA